MKKKRKLKFYLYIDRSEKMRVRQNKFAMEDGELRLELTVFVPEQFFKPFSFEAQQTIIVKNKDLPLVEMEVSPS